MGLRDRTAEQVIRLASRLTTRVAPSDLIRVSTAMLDAVDEVSQHRWAAAQERAAGLPGDIRPEKLDALTRTFCRELGVAGAAAGAAAGAPGVGTATTLAATTAELAWFTARAGDLILTIAALHGRPDPTVIERRAWVLAVLIYGTSARDELARSLNQVSTGLDPVSSRRLPLSSLQAANRLMSKSLLKRYGARRGAVALGRILPAGIGAAIGGSANYFAIRSLASSADMLFARLPYSAIDVDSTDITDHQLG